MCEVRVQEAIPSEMRHLPDGIWLRRAVRSDIGVHVVVRLQAISIHPSVRTSHPKQETRVNHESGDLPLRAHACEPKPFLKFIQGSFPILVFFLFGGRRRELVDVWDSEVYVSDFARLDPHRVQLVAQGEEWIL